jgi:hypothetical protein
MYLTDVAQDGDKWRAVVDAVMNFRFRKNRGIVWDVICMEGSSMVLGKIRNMELR